MTYLWTEQDGDEMSGGFDSIEAAIADAAKVAAERDDPMTIEVYDSRPATADDRESFEWSEDVDVEELNWWEKCVVPENVMRTHTFPKETPALFPTCEAVGTCPCPTVEAAPYHHFYWDSDRDGARMNQIHNHGKGHDEPLSNYGAVLCKTCGQKALVLSEADDFPQI